MNFTRLIRGVICFLAERHSWSGMPQVLRQSNAPDRIAKGDVECSLCLLMYIKELYHLRSNNSNMKSERHFGDKVQSGVKPKMEVTSADKILVTNFDQSSTMINPSSNDRNKARNGIPPPADTIASSAAQSELTRKVTRHANNMEGSIHPSCENRLDSDSARARTAIFQADRSAEGGIKRPNNRSPSPRQPTAIRMSTQQELKRDHLTDHHVVDPPLPTFLRAEIISWLNFIGVNSSSSAARQRKDGSSSTSRPSPLEDPWCNGVLLSELAAVLCKNADRNMVKEVHNNVLLICLLKTNTK